MPKRPQPKAPRRTYSIYVIELDRAVLQDRRFRQKNPEVRAGKPCVYVGMTSSTPEERFRQHRAGYKAARIARHYGVRLRPRLFAQLRDLTWEEAKAKEVWRAESLRRRGYGVWQN